MTDLHKAAEMALRVLENPWKAKPDDVADAIEALRQALAPKELPRPDQPIWSVDDKGNKQLVAKENRAPPKREWVGLTDEEIAECKIDGGLPHAVNWRLSAKVLQAKLKEKNT